MELLPNEVFALECRKWYEEQGLVVDGTNGQFAHCPFPEGMGETGYFLLWEHHQHQGLLQSRDVGKKCFWSGETKRWLKTCSYWPNNFFELWDIYDEYTRKTGKEVMSKLHYEKDNLGRSLHALKIHQDKDEHGRSVLAVRVCEKVHSEKDENGVSLMYLRTLASFHEEKNEAGKSKFAVEKALLLNKEKDGDGRSLRGVKNASKTSSQRWQCLSTGKISTPGPLTLWQKSRGIDPAMRKRLPDENPRTITSLTVVDPEGTYFQFNSIRAAVETLGISASSLLRISRGESSKKYAGYKVILKR